MDSGGEPPHGMADDERVLTGTEVTRFGVAPFGKRGHPAAIRMVAVDTHGVVAVDEDL